MRKFQKVLLLFFLFVLSPLPVFAVVVGPFTGTVLDSRTGDPIENASVLMYWTKIVPRGPFLGPGSAPVKSELVYADRAGRYSIPKFNADIGLMGALEATHIIIYQPGYEAYIANICHVEYSCTKNDAVKEKNNLAKLDRIPPEFNHEKHIEKIKDALHGLEYPDKDIKLIIVLNEKEFLRRTEWEERRKDRQ